MADEHHEWNLGEPEPVIRAHSLAKHRVLEHYLIRYVDALTRDVRIPELRLTLVDGFAGGGVYRDWRTNDRRLGSPLLMLKAMRDAAECAQARRSRSAFHMDVEYFFVEKAKNAFDFLRASIRESGVCDTEAAGIKLLNSDFVNEVDAIIAHVRRRGRGNRAIFVLDQFGYSAVPFTALRRILSELSNAEIILTFAVDSLIDYMSERNSMKSTLHRLGIEISADRFAIARQSATDSRAARLRHTDVNPGVSRSLEGFLLKRAAQLSVIGVSRCRHCFTISL